MVLVVVEDELDVDVFVELDAFVNTVVLVVVLVFVVFNTTMSLSLTDTVSRAYTRIVKKAFAADF